MAMGSTEKYPLFIPDRPVGWDLFEGYSKEILAYIVCDHIGDTIGTTARI